MNKTHTYESALADSLRYFNGEPLPADTFLSKYALRDLSNNLLESNPDQMHWRMAKEFARIETGKFKEPYSAEFIYELFKDFGYIIPQGSPMYGIGNPRAISLSNCFVISCPDDSYSSIHKTDEELTQISKRRGGIGTDLSKLRPAGALTRNSSRTSSGVPAFMQRYSNSINEVGQAGRRGALMLTLSVHHPDIIEFCKIKLDPTKVTGANVSVRLTDEFLMALASDGMYEQRFPVDSPNPTISKMVKARDVWKVIIECAHARAEPGLLFWDTILRESPADCYAKFGFNSVCCNPCAELILCIFDSCRLLLQNLLMYVNNPFMNDAYFDFDKFANYSKIAQRLMDDLVDLELEKITQILAKIDSDPEPESVKRRERETWEAIREKCVLGRRTGTGITAIGDAMAAIGIKYGSPESLDFVDKVYKTMKLAAYRSSVDMAKELGPFPIFDAELEKDCSFLLRIAEEDPELYADMQKYGRRNIALLTTAPAGTVSLEAGPGPHYGTTSGIEPAFEIEHYRRKKINDSDENARVDFIDQNGVRWQNYPVYHPKVKMWMEATGETDLKKSPYYGACANDLDWRFRVRLQATATKHVDHSISSTVNIPESATIEDVAMIYEEAWKEKCKGMTVYRDKCRSGVLISAAEANKVATDAVKRPKTLPCSVYRISSKGIDYCVLVGLLEDVPYEVFAGKAADLSIPRSIKTGVIVKAARGCYRLLDGDGKVICENLTEFISDEEEALTRLTSTSLRHHVPLHYLVHQLEKTKGQMNGFAKGLARTLKKYIEDGTKVSGETCPQCKGSAMRRQEGCVTCADCGYSKCS